MPLAIARQNGQTLSVMPTAPQVQPFDSLSAIGQLQILAKRGVVPADEITGMLLGVPGKQAAAQAAALDNAARQAQAEMQILPLKSEAEQASLRAGIDQIPVRAAADKLSLQIAQQKLDGMNKFKELEDAATKAEYQATIEKNKTLAEKAQEEREWGDDLPAWKFFKENIGGQVPKTADGKVDRPALVKQVQERWVRDEFAKSTMQKELSDIAKSKGAAGLKVLQKVLNDPTDENINAALSKLNDLPSEAASAALKDVDANVAADQTDQWINHTRELIGKPGLDPVGPVAGSAAGRFWAWTKAASGGDASRYNAQSQIRQGLNTMIARATTVLKGALSEKELKFIVDSVPKLSDTPEVWNAYLNQAQASLAKARAAKQQMGGGLPPGVTGPVAGPLVAPANAGPGAKYNPSTGKWVWKQDGQWFTVSGQ